MINDILWSYIYALVITIIALTIYGMATRPNIVKKLIMLSMLFSTACLMAVIIGVHSGSIKPPVYPGITFTEHPWAGTAELDIFSYEAVDPILQVLVMVAIIIGSVVLLFLGYVAIMVYRRYGTLDMRLIELRRREGYG